jgi:hypothetical protein
MIIMVVFIMICMIIVMVVMVVMVAVDIAMIGVFAEDSRFPGLKQAQPFNIQQLNLCRISRQVWKRIAQPWGQPFPNPKHDLRVLQGRRRGGPQAVAMWAGPWIDDQFWATHTDHDLRHEGVDRRNIGSDVRNIGNRGATAENEGEREELVGHDLWK